MAERQMVPVVKNFETREGLTHLPISPVDGTLDVETLVRAFPGAHSLIYKDTSAGGLYELLKNNDGTKYQRPINGWENKVCLALISASLSPPRSNIIDKWIFYAADQAGKSTVVCVHPRYFITFRHGAHLDWNQVHELRIYPAKLEMDQHDGHLVTVVDINEEMDFVLLRSKDVVVQESPRLVDAEESEQFLLAGFGDCRDGAQGLAYMYGNIYSLRGIYDYMNGKVFGPFIMGTVPSSPGDSGGACFSARGLIGINYGLTQLPAETPHDIVHSAAAVHSPKNIISPARDIKKSFERHLLLEEPRSASAPPCMKNKQFYG